MATQQQSFSYDPFQPWQSTQQPQPAQSGFRQTGPFQPTTYQTGMTTGTTMGTTTGTSTMMPVAPNIPLPTLTLPEWNEGRIRELRRRYMAPVRSLRQGLRRTLASMPSATNVAVAREMGRGAVEGFGTGVSTISTGAGREALGEYRAERAEEISAAQMNFQAAMQDYLARFGRTTTTAGTTMTQTRTQTQQRTGPQYQTPSQFGQPSSAPQIPISQWGFTLRGGHYR